MVNNLQKRCLCCGAISPESVATCPKCGEGSWAAVILPTPEPVAVKTPAPVYVSSKGRR